MELSKAICVWRWLVVPLASLVGFFAAIVLAEPLNWLIHYFLWTYVHPIPGKMFLMYVCPYDGALAASLLIQFGTYAAPSHKKLTAFCLLICGGIMAWQMVGEFYSPDALVEHGVRHGPVRVWWPIVGTYLGGILTFAWISLTARKDRVIRIA